MVGVLLQHEAQQGGAALGERQGRFRTRAAVRSPKPGAAPSPASATTGAAHEGAGGAETPTGSAPRDAAQARQTATFKEEGTAQAWTPPSWEEIVSNHSTRVYRLAYRLMGNRHDAEDLTQEVFVRVFRSLSTYTPGTFEGWLHRITTNLFLDTMRRRQRIRFDALGDDAAERLPSREPTPDKHFHDAHFDADVQHALDALAPEFRAAVVLCDIEGLSYEEIAATLGVKLGTVRSRIHRGRSHLRKDLKHRAPGTARSTTSAAGRHPDLAGAGARGADEVGRGER